MATNKMFLRDMKTTKNIIHHTSAIRHLLLLMLFLAGGARPCGTLCLQRMVSEAWFVMS